MDSKRKATGRKMKTRLYLLAVIAIASFSTGCASMRPAPAYLDVFDCLIPVPPGYAFNTIDSSTTHAYSAHPGQEAWGELNVWNNDGPIAGDHYEVLATRKRGRLEILEIRLRDLGAPGGESDLDSILASESLIVVTDGMRNLSLGGDARRFAISMVDACLANSHQ